jgi:hypothetical protein
LVSACLLLLFLLLPLLQAKLADFGLHKRVRKMTSSGALVSWNQETTYHGGEFEKSFYGGKLYLNKSAMSIASSMQDDDSVYNGSLSNGNSLHGGSMHNGSAHGGGSWHRAAAANALLNSAANDSAYALGAAHGTAGTAAAAAPVSGKPPLPARPSISGPAVNGDATGAGAAVKGAQQCSDSAASIADGSVAAGGKVKQLQEAEVLRGAVRAKSQGLLAQQDFVTRVLSVPSSSTALQQVGNTVLKPGFRQCMRSCRVY